MGLFGCDATDAQSETRDTQGEVAYQLDKSGNKVEIRTYGGLTTETVEKVVSGTSMPASTYANNAAGTTDVVQVS